MIHPFANLSPEMVLDAVESIGLLSDARVMALNSYENRVYQVGIEQGEPLIAKFYRPERWNDDEILEEHAFCAELSAQEIPVIAPLTFEGRSLFEFGGFRFALFQRRGGQAPEPGNPEHLYRLGQLLGRLHAVGASRPFQARESLNCHTFGQVPLQLLKHSEQLTGPARDNYLNAAQALLHEIEQRFAAIDYQSIRLHGDCHPGNLLLRDDHLYMVDLDDSRMGPAMQDLWMLLAGDRQEQQMQLAELVEGYQEFYDFDRREIALIEPLRGLRQLHYSAWLAKRWDDPAFPQSFPWFGSQSYWEQQTANLVAQRHALSEEPLRLY